MVQNTFRPRIAILNIEARIEYVEGRSAIGRFAEKRWFITKFRERNRGCFCV
jgi:hypothetical protein